MAAPIIQPSAPRMLPRLTDDNREYWTAASDGILRLPFCPSCRRYFLPASRICPSCEAPATLEAVSGRARLMTWTLNSYQFHPDIPPPNLIAVVEMAEQEDLRMATNLVDCEEADLRAGLELTAVFEQHGEVFYPLFTPAAA